METAWGSRRRKSRRGKGVAKELRSLSLNKSSVMKKPPLANFLDWLHQKVTYSKRDDVGPLGQSYELRGRKFKLFISVA